jgi:hypothetical protein
MERRINKKIETYITKFKDDIRDKTTELGVDSLVANQLLQFVYDYDRLSFDKEDLSKRKRVKNVVPFFDRCCAKRASGEQCTRRRKDDTTEYCGTHLKGTPHGIIDHNQNQNTNHMKKIEVWAQDINGIIYYIDTIGNVYKTEDIIMNKSNPAVIAKYTVIDGTYAIPSFGI